MACYYSHFRNRVGYKIYWRLIKWLKKTSCGGLKIDNETIVESNGVLKVNGVPDASEATNGQILVVNDGEWVIADNPSTLPSVTVADAGRVLMVDATGKWVVGSLN